MALLLMALTGLVSVPVGAQEGDKAAQDQLIELTAKWMENQGDPGSTAAAGQLRKRYSDKGTKTIFFAAPPEGCNGCFDPRTGYIFISPDVVNTSFCGTGANRKPVFEAIPSLSSTLQHELTHQNQDNWAWKASVWKELAGYGNRCEVAAWKVGFEAILRDIRRYQTELEKAENRSWTDRAAIAGRLDKVCQLFIGYHATYVDEGHVATYGPLPGIPARDGFPRTFDEVLADVTGIRKKAQDTVILAQGYTGKTGLGSEYARKPPPATTPPPGGMFPPPGHVRHYEGNGWSVIWQKPYGNGQTRNEEVGYDGNFRTWIVSEADGRTTMPPRVRVTANGQMSWEDALYTKKDFDRYQRGSGTYNRNRHYTGQISPDGNTIKGTVVTEIFYFTPGPSVMDPSSVSEAYKFSTPFLLKMVKQYRCR